MPEIEDHSRIEELKKSLYSRSAPDVRTRRKLHFGDIDSPLPTSWQNGPLDDKADIALNPRYENHSMSFFTKLLIASGIFCVIAVSIGAYLFLNGANIISANNIDITISGPVSIPGGTPVSFDIAAINKNNVDLQLVDMAVVFPAGTTNPKDPTQELKTYTELIGDMQAGGTAHKTIDAIIFGEENMQKQINVTLTYKVKGSSSLFTKQKSYDVLINSSPISVTASAFKEITSGQEFDMKVTLKSNSQETLKNVIVKGQYPFGYVYISSNIPAVKDNATWKIGDIPAGGERTIIVHGKLQGEDNDARTFHFFVGAQSSTNSMAIGTLYASVGQDLTIQKPFVSVKVLVDNDEPTSDHIGRFGQNSRIELVWFNNLTVPVSHVQISAKLSGSAYEKTAVRPDLGYFKSGSNEITWNQQTNPELASIAPGASGSIFFSVTPIDKSTSSTSVVDPTLSIVASISGSRAQENNVPESLSSATTRTIRVSSNIALSGKVIRNTGPFTNTGPVPPRAEHTTTYTVVWSVNNTSSSVNNAQVVATLPPYVKWLNAVSPSTENVSYDPNSGTITWAIGNVSTYTSNSARRREASFQVSFEPSVNQVDQSPTLVNEATLTANDTFTGATLDSKQDYLTTRFSTDPSYKGGDETVIR